MIDKKLRLPPPDVMFELIKARSEEIQRIGVCWHCDQCPCDCRVKRETIQEESK